MDEQGQAPPTQRTTRAGATLLEDAPDQRYVGGRDLIRWPSAVGRAVLAAGRWLHRWFAADQVLALTLVVGVAVLALATVLAGEVYESVVEASGVAGLDQPALEAAKSLRTPAGTTLVQAWTTVGGPVGMPVVATLAALGLALLWRQWSPVVLVAATAAGSLVLTIAGKELLGRARPAFSDAVPPYELSPSFPSGHSLNAAAIAGTVAYLVVRRLHSARARGATVALAGAFAVTIGLTRVYLGHHWTTDVLFGWALGAAWLAVVVIAHRVFLTLHHHGASAGRQT